MNSEYVDFSRWAPRSAMYWALRPQKAARRLLAEAVPLAVRVRPSGDPALAGRGTLTWWSYDRGQLGDKLHLTFPSTARVTNLDARWRVIARAIWRMVRKDPGMVFHEVAVDLEDGATPGLPESVFAFARLRGAGNALLPNPYLLRDRDVGKPRAWEAKKDTLYFRGADSGAITLEANTRVVLCRLAKDLPRTSCLLTRLVQGTPEAHAQMRQEGLVGKRIPIPDMNKYRFLVDADGNTTSWDRYMLIGAYGSVPILFEPAWEECWHGDLVDGENCVLADRHTLGPLLERLRADDAYARKIAAGASRLVATRLSPEGVQALFEAAWKAR